MNGKKAIWYGCNIIWLILTASSAFPQISGGLPPLKRSTQANKVENSISLENNYANTQTSPITKTLTILNQQINFTLPPGFCSLGSSDREKELLESTKKTLGISIKLVFVGVNCAELKTFVSGQRDAVDNFMQIQLIGPRGDFKRLEISRENYLNAISQQSAKLSNSELEEKMKKIMQDADVNLLNTDIKDIGRDGNAFYMTTKSTINYDGNLRTVVGLGGSTLINSLPLSVLVFDAAPTRNTQSKLHSVLRISILSLLSEN